MAKRVYVHRTVDGLESWSGDPTGSLEPGLTDRYASKIREHIPVGFRGLMTARKDSDRVLCIPSGEVPMQRFERLLGLEVDNHAELLEWFLELGRTLPIFRSDPERFRAQNRLLEPHSVGYTRCEGVFVLLRPPLTPAS